MLADALRLCYGDELYYRYMEKEIIFSILPQILGQMVCSYCSEIKIKDKILTIKVVSSPLKSNLALQKTTIVEKINAEIGTTFVDNIVFL